DLRQGRPGCGPPGVPRRAGSAQGPDRGPHRSARSGRGRRMSRTVVVTGGGALGPPGGGVERLTEAALAGRVACARGDRACAARLTEEPDPGTVPANVWRRLDRCSRIALVAVREAVRTAGEAGDAPIADGAGLVVGTMTG